MCSLLARLLIVVAIAVIPALAFQAYTESKVRQTRQQLVEDEARRLVTLVSAEQRRIIEGADQMLSALGTVPFVQDANAALCRHFLTNLDSLMARFDGIAVVGPDGHPLCASVPYDPHADIANRAWFQKALASGRPVFGEYGSDLSAAQPAVPIARGFKRQDGSAGGVIIAELSPTWLQQQLQAIPLPAEAVIFVVDRNGIVLAHWPNHDEVIGKPIPPGNIHIPQETRPGITSL